MSRTTDHLRIDPAAADAAVISRAADIIRAGGAVAFPTETVYGLGADALNPDAVKRVFHAKGRPATNPVIVHVADAAQAMALVTEWTGAAQRLAERFWPGPLTLVLPRRAVVPDVVTAGGPTVAVRCPNHAVVLALIRAAETPIAAPSANRSGELSPTRAEHVLSSLGGTIPMVLDGGPVPGGVESTVIDVSGGPPRLLRPGLLTSAAVEAVVGPLRRGRPPADEESLRSPGMLTRHYAPKTELICCDEPCDMPTPRESERILVFGAVPHLPPGTTISLPDDPTSASKLLYETLHRLDRLGLDRILVILPPDTDDWLAVRDRLRRAATR